jgi:branched-chain amino acid transport system permease protein
VDNTFGKVFFAAAAGMAIYVLMAGILLYKPEGLFK